MKKAKECHHLTYEHLFYEEEYPQDVITVCKKCHWLEDQKRKNGEKDKLTSIQ